MHLIEGRRERRFFAVWALELGSLAQTVHVDANSARGGRR
ncbi:hypothetical protein AKJ09_07183 [Labilithrix luteola]|uniref:Uncharacterized protein n=1 Tax=Labilithrix luteola TaxID=1391654 RepID=A0A0K1Q533_9BACT|nr:hypothetical protein AKJ09_07183 [Labilithrix luteola]